MLIFIALKNHLATIQCAKSSLLSSVRGPFFSFESRHFNAFCYLVWVFSPVLQESYQHLLNDRSMIVSLGATNMATVIELCCRPITLTMQRQKMKSVTFQALNNRCQMSVCPEGRDPLTNSIGFKADHDELKLGLVVTYCTLWAVNYLDMRLND